MQNLGGTPTPLKLIEELRSWLDVVRRQDSLKKVG